MGVALAFTNGELIRKARRDAGLTQAQLAGAVGVSRETLNAWENDRREPSFREGKRIATVTSADWLWDQLSSQLNQFALQ